MKPRNKFCLLAIGAAALAINISTSSAQVFDHTDTLNNRAIAASPRAKEAFPWLARQSGSESLPGKPNSKPGAQKTQTNRALAASPRMVEQFPELVRPAQYTKQADTATAGPSIKNRALAASPRVREEFPWLLRGYYTVKHEPFEIAPLK